MPVPLEADVPEVLVLSNVQSPVQAFRAWLLSAFSPEDKAIRPSKGLLLGWRQWLNPKCPHFPNG
jgi:hypothetical protein